MYIHGAISFSLWMSHRGDTTSLAFSTTLRTLLKVCDNQLYIKGWSACYFSRLISTHWFSFLIFQASTRLTQAKVMDHLRCNFLVPGTTWMVENPITGGQYHQTIASLWISHLVDNIPLSPVMAAHISSAQLSNPHPLNTQIGMLLTSDLPSPLAHYFSTSSHFPPHYKCLRTFTTI